MYIRYIFSSSYLKKKQHFFYHFSANYIKNIFIQNPEMEFKIISQNLNKKKFETSVLLPIRQDKRVYALLTSLSNQKYKNFVLLIANDSKEPYIKKEEFPKKLNYIYYHTPEEKYSQYEKLNFLIDKIETPYVATTESDCEPSEEWLSELITIVKKEDTAIKGCEARPVGSCTANLIMPTKILKEVKFDDKIAVIADFELGMNLQRHGYPLKTYNDKGKVFHNLGIGKPNYKRIIPCARDEVYIAFKYKDKDFIWKKILRNGYNAFFGVSEILLSVFIFIPYFYLKGLFGDKK